MADTSPLTLEQFLKLHPWRPEVVAHGAPVEGLWHFDLPVTAEALWPHLSDTSRLNRAMGLGEMALTEKDGALHATTSYGGVEHVWVERPWSWVAGRYLVIEREYERGFSRCMRVIYRLEPLPVGVRAYVYVGSVPRSFLARLAIRIGTRSSGQDHARVLPELGARLRDEAPPYRLPPARLERDVLARVHGLREQLSAGGLGGPALDKLVWWISTADDLDIYRLQVRRLAAVWGVDELELLRTCLHATRAGLLQMSWDVICPHCRGVREEARTLGDVPARGSCAACEIDFATDRDNALEITFHVHPSVRDVPKVYYCSAEPAAKAHVQVQQAVAPGDAVSLETLLEPGRYRLRLKGRHDARVLEVSADGAARQVAWRAGAAGELRAGARPTLELVNDTERAQTFLVEAPTWADAALRPVHLFNFQEFRDLFSEEYLATDIQLAVGEQTILFSDIVGSTRFYVDRGDPGAFMEVKRHFAEVYELVKKHRGAVVKTIGDAAMGAFSNPVDALEAAREIHARFHADRRDSPVRLRISINTGPCIAVNLNSGIDYFGNAVNLAAKLQSCAGAGDIALSAAVRAAPGVAAYLERQAAALEELSFAHEAFPEPLTVYRWATF